MTKLKFCPNCGHKFDYRFAPPKFCSNCGSSTARGAQVDFDHRTSPKIDEEEEVDSVPKIDKLKASIEFDSNVLTMDYNDSEGFSFKEKKFKKRNTSF